MNVKRALVVILLLGLIWRIFLIPVARHGDVNNNTSWGQSLLIKGPVDFYESKNWQYSTPNQPPLYVLLFGATAALQNSLSSTFSFLNTHVQAFPSKIIWWFDQWGELYIAKLPGIAADIALSFVIYKVVGGRKGLLLASVWLLNPITWYNSAIWGGTDSIVNLLGVLSVYLLYKKRLTASVSLFSLSLLFKGSLLVFLPVWLLIAYMKKFSMSNWLHALVISLIMFVCICVWFHPNIDLPVWFFNLYTNKFLPGEIGSLTANAFNMWWLVDPGTTLDNTLFWGTSARTVGILITCLYMLSILYRTYRLKKETSYLSFALVAFISFLFMTRIHERYLYPVFPFATISLGSYPLLIVPYAVLSSVHLLNLYHLFWAPGMLTVQAWYTNPQFMQLLAVVHVLVFITMFLLFFLKKPLLHGK